MSNVLELTGAELRFGPRRLWSDLDLAVEAGQFVAVLGANGSGKSSLLKTVLGLTALTQGSATVLGRPAGRGNARVGYVPQQKTLSASVPVRGRDFVEMGFTGARWGPPRPGHTRDLVEQLLRSAHAEDLADRPLALMSGGEQQRLRVLQALASQPALLLCDEPLLSLDPNYQRQVVELIDQHRRQHHAAVLFVTHEINPIMDVADLVLYLADGRFRLGDPSEVMTSAVLSDLYRSPVEVIRRGNRVAVIGLDDATSAAHHEHGLTYPSSAGSR